MAKLNIGCGKYYLDGWVNIDKDETLITDHCYDISWGIENADDSVDEILLSHVLMYFTKRPVVRILKECFRVLKHGGVLRVTEDTPLKKRNKKQQKQYGNGVLFWVEEMVDLLYEAGFTEVRRAKPFKEVNHHMNLPDTFPLYKGPGAVYFLTATT